MQSSRVEAAAAEIFVVQLLLVHVSVVIVAAVAVEIVSVAPYVVKNAIPAAAPAVACAPPLLSEAATSARPWMRSSSKLRWRQGQHVQSSRVGAAAAETVL